MAVTQEILFTSAVYIGAFVIAVNVVIPLTWLLLKHCVLARFAFGRKRWLLNRRGAWAAITGATDGIGKAYAFALAADGLNIILISRTESKLQAVANEIREKYDVKVDTVVADFVRTDIYEKIEEKLKEYELACLVNNVGMALPFPNVFVGKDMFDDQISIDLFNTNALSMLRMTRIGIEVMGDRSKNQIGGIIINIGSASGIHPLPLEAVYSATKAFANFFSSAVDTELKHSCYGNGNSIRIQNVLPMFVATKMTGIRKSSFFVRSSSSFVDEALNLIDIEDTTLGCLSHSIQAFIGNLLPDSVNSSLTWKFLSDGRRRALAKLAKAK